MQLLNKIWQYLKAPKMWFLITFYIIFFCCLGGTITLVVLQQNQSVWHFLLYFLSAILLSYFIYSIIYLAPKIKEKIILSMKKHSITNKLLEDFGYRTIIFSIFSFILNIGYVVFMGVFAIKTNSAWYISITIYYLALAMMKGNIFYSKKKYNTPRKQARAYRYCGIMFFLLNFAFSGILVLIFTTNMSFKYAGLMIYVVAVFTFYKLTLAIINTIKAIKQEEDLYVQGIRTVNLTSALVSLVVLQVAMFQAFAPEQDASLFNVITGGLVSVIVFVLAILMIIKANKRLKIINNAENNSKSLEKIDKID